MIGYIYQGEKSDLAKSAPSPISKDEVHDLVAAYRNGGLEVKACVYAGCDVYIAEKDSMVAFFVIGDSMGDFSRAAKEAGLK